MKNTSTENIVPVKDKKDDLLENDLILIKDKYEKGSKPVIDLINLFEKYDGNCRWQIMAQICSYSILFKESSNLLAGVEQFMMLINEKSIANSDIIMVRNGSKCIYIIIVIILFQLNIIFSQHGINLLLTNFYSISKF